jgi:hypothetical protein
MWQTWAPLISLAVIIIPLWALKRWITLHLQGVGLLVWGDSEMAMVLYFLALLPGIVVHELSHWLFAKALGVRTGKMSIWPRRQNRGRVRLGSVQVTRVDPFRSSLIGLAPLLVGSLVIFLIGDRVLSVSRPINAALNADWNGLWASLGSTTQASDFWIWLYVIFAVSNAMFPSESDRQSWLPVLVLLTLIGAVAYLSGVLTDVGPEVIGGLRTLSRYLAYAFALTVVVDIGFGAVIAAVEYLLALAKRTRVQY